MFHKITSVTPMQDLTLLVHFSDGQAKTYAVRPLLARIPAFRSLEEIPGLFNQVHVEPGGYAVAWNDDLDLDGEEIWVNGCPIRTPFDRLLSFGDATALWGLNESTLRKAVSYHKLVDGVDVKKFGKQWVVTADAMEREYGPLTRPET